MSTAILGKKIGMTQIFDESGHRVPVTVIQAGPCVVTDRRTLEKHKYTALQVAFEEIPERKLNKPEAGLYKQRQLKPMRFLQEIRMPAAEVEKYKIGDPVTVSIFTAGEKVDVVGTSKGRGFQGVVRRYRFKGGTQTRGTHEYRRHPGSIGNREWPGKVFKGRKLPGQMGDDSVTTQNLVLSKIDTERNLLLVRGAVPGGRNALVLIRKAKKQTTRKSQ